MTKLTTWTDFGLVGLALSRVWGKNTRLSLMMTWESVRHFISVSQILSIDIVEWLQDQWNDRSPVILVSAEIKSLSCFECNASSSSDDSRSVSVLMISAGRIRGFEERSSMTSSARTLRASARLTMRWFQRLMELAFAHTTR